MTELQLLHRQRAFLMGIVLHLMSTDHSDSDVVKLKLSVATAMVDELEKGYSLSDEVERVVMKSIKSMLEKEQALQEIKDQLRDTGPF